jgi:pyridoxal phosphate enzyme (YggS family)
MNTRGSGVAWDSMIEAFAERLHAVEQRIEAACARAGRERSEVTLVAVSKTRSIEEIEVAYICGLRHLGENRVEEAGLKVPVLREQHVADPVTWHMIGHVQGRKARDAVRLCDVIHSVDSRALMLRLDRMAGETGKRIPVLFELNVSGEPSKYGWAAHDASTLDQAMEEIAGCGELAHLDVRGLMTMAPIVSEMELARPVFARLRAIQEILRQRLPFSTWSELSMGMTDDFEVAIEEGATIVRIGRALFGGSGTQAVYHEEKKP